MGITRHDTEMHGNHRLPPIDRMTVSPDTYTYALRLLGKLLFVSVLPISGSCRSMVYMFVLIHSLCIGFMFHPSVHCKLLQTEDIIRENEINILYMQYQLYVLVNVVVCVDDNIDNSVPFHIS